MYKLSVVTKNRIEKSTGIEFEKMREMDWQEIDRELSMKAHKRIDFPKNKDNRVLGRGSIFISLMRFAFIKDTNKRLSKIR